MGAVIPLEAFKDQDFYVPAFNVLVEGKERREEMNDVMSLSYSDSLTDIDSFDLTINNWDAEQLRFKYSDGDIFNPWKDVEVWMGYYRNGLDQRRRMLIGEITTMTPNFPQSGAPTLTVRGLNLFHRFRTERKTRPFFKRRDTQIAKLLVDEIAAGIKNKSNRFTLKLDQADQDTNREQEQEIDYLLMQNQFPIVFLMERARDIGYELTMEEEPKGKKREVTFHFRPSHRVQHPTYILEWGKTLISFQPTFSVSNQAAELTVRGWSPRTKKEIKVTVKRTDIKGILTPSELGVKEPDLAKQIEIVADRPIESEAEARLLATSKLKQICDVLVEAKGKTIGLPDLRAGSKVQIVFPSVGAKNSRFSGTYVVTATTHTINDSGYTTDFSARREKP
jgi:phage protein D